MIELLDGTKLTFEQQTSRIPQPALRIEFSTLESWNDYLKVARKPQAAEGIISRLRVKAARQAVFWAERQGYFISRWSEFGATEKGNITEKKFERIEPVIFERAKCFVRYWRPTWATYDTLSPLVKPLFDGFKDAGVYPDDSFKHLPDVYFNFMGIDDSLKLSKEARESRRNKKKVSSKSQLVHARFWFDFYHF